MDNSAASTLLTTTLPRKPIVVDLALFYQYTSLVILYSCSTAFLFDLLFRSYRSQWLMKASTCFVLNIGICAFHSAFALLFYGYFLLELGRQKPAFPVAVFVSAFASFGFARSMSMCLLLVDRILALTLPIYYRRNSSHFVTLKALLCLVTSLLYGSVWIWRDWPFDDTTACDVPLCVFRKDGGYTASLFRTALSIISTAFCFIFYYVVRTYIDSTATSRHNLKNVRKIHRLIGFSTFAEIAFNFLPSLIRNLSTLVGGIPFYQVLGLFSDLVKVMDVLFTAVVYWFQLRKLIQKIVFVASDR